MSDSFSLPQPDSQPPQRLPNDSQPPVLFGAELSSEISHRETIDNAHAPADRRKRRRSLISAPLRVRSKDSEGINEVSATVDVSRNGVLFVTSNQSFHRGMEVSVIFPYTKSPGVAQSEQPGVIARVSGLSHGRIAVAIAFGLGMGQPATGAEQVSATAAASIVSNALNAKDSKKPLILAVEANASLRDSLKTYLSSEGYRVIAVENATDAREVLNILTPALLIAEIEGEGLPGFDLCAHIKTTPRLQHIPVMLTTGSAYPSDYSSAHSLGAVVCMAKPFRQDRLGHVVRLLVPPTGIDPNADPPHAPDPKRRPKAIGISRRDAGQRRFR